MTKLTNNIAAAKTKANSRVISILTPELLKGEIVTLPGKGLAVQLQLSDYSRWPERPLFALYNVADNGKLGMKSHNLEAKEIKDLLIITGVRFIDSDDLKYIESARAWAERTNHDFVDASPIPTDFYQGERVNVINGYGYLIEDLVITGFTKDTAGTFNAYLNWDCYWYPVALDRLRKIGQ